MNAYTLITINAVIGCAACLWAVIERFTIERRPVRIGPELLQNRSEVRRALQEQRRAAVAHQLRRLATELTDLDRQLDDISNQSGTNVCNKVRGDGVRDGPQHPRPALDMVRWAYSWSIALGTSMHSGGDE